MRQAVSASSDTHFMFESVVAPPDLRWWFMTELVLSDIRDELLGTIRSIIVPGN